MLSSKIAYQKPLRRNEGSFCFCRPQIHCHQILGLNFDISHNQKKNTFSIRFQSIPSDFSSLQSVFLEMIKNDEDIFEHQCRSSKIKKPTKAKCGPIISRVISLKTNSQMIYSPFGPSETKLLTKSQREELILS